MKDLIDRVELLEDRVTALEKFLVVDPPTVKTVMATLGRAAKDLPIEALMEINAALGTKFRPVHANLKYIMARLSEGATISEIVDVARLKKQEWGADPDMRKYLRIETLYNATKFQSYLAEVDQARERAKQYDELR